MNFLQCRLIKCTRYFYQQLRRCSSESNTIFALSSGAGKCGVSIIRVSGPQTKKALQALVGTKFEPKERYAHLKALRHPTTREVIDEGLVLWFPGPASFTGEDSCEFQVHGSIAVVEAMYDALSKVYGLRPALPGEFTKRAFFGGKLDLVQVEGLADLIHAETEAQRKQALIQTSGSLSELYNGWRTRLIRCTAQFEAIIDFGEEENIDQQYVEELIVEARKLIFEIHRHLNDERRGEMLRDGVRTAIVGATNVGKSSFLNVLCQRNVSIVTPIAGTTRDVIEATQNFNGYPVCFADTAGLRRKTKDPIEREGICRARECVNQSDVVVLIISAFDLYQRNILTSEEFECYLREYLIELDLTENTLKGKHMQVVINKVDLVSELYLEFINTWKNVSCISCENKQNLQSFLSGFEQTLNAICGSPSRENPRITHSRYRSQLECCVQQLEVFINEFSPDEYADMAVSAQKLRLAIRCIERITGHVSSDDILDVIFNEFCIGK